MRNVSRSRNQLLKNKRILAKFDSVLCISPEGKQIGVMAASEALALAKSRQLDLLLINPKTYLPVCKICDSGKYKYNLRKKSRDHKGVTPKLKEIKFRPRTESHDYEVKLRHAEEFLYKGNRVKMTLTFRGREREYKSTGKELMEKVAGHLEHVGVPEGYVEGRNNLSRMFVPLKSNRKLKYNVAPEANASDPIAK